MEAPVDDKTITRKDFILLTFTLVGSAAVGAAACSDDNNNNGNDGGAGGTGGGTSCSSPQVADDTAHTHTVAVPASALAQTSPQTFTTSEVGAHTHMITLSVADLGMLSSGQTVSAVSTSNGTTPHMHTYTISCS
jgi:hypothetical protein